MIHSPIHTIPLTDKWILSSAVQKSIRRGREHEAVMLALHLHSVDPAYLRRRLPVIALEDVGMADERSCRHVIENCVDSRAWQEDQEELIVSLVQLLARARKSRAACDAWCVVNVHPQKQQMAAHAACMPVERLLEELQGNGASLVKKAFAAAALFDSIRDAGSRAEQACLLGEVLGELKLTEDRRYLVGQRSKTAGLSTVLLALPAAPPPAIRPINEFPGAFEFVAGVPLCALDQYTRVGKTLISSFIDASEPIRHYLVKSNRRSLVNMALFQAESSLLDKCIASEEIDALHEELEDAELSREGLPHGSRLVLHELLRENAFVLADLRRKWLGRVGGVCVSMP
jgi:hypothetical protein